MADALEKLGRPGDGGGSRIAVGRSELAGVGDPSQGVGDR
jgi:hypothetical protein